VSLYHCAHTLRCAVPARQRSELHPPAARREWRRSALRQRATGHSAVLLSGWCADGQVGHGACLAADTQNSLLDALRAGHCVTANSLVQITAQRPACPHALALTLIGSSPTRRARQTQRASTRVHSSPSCHFQKEPATGSLYQYLYYY
jgi:hypothetical protein